VPGLLAPDAAVVERILRSSELRAKHAAAISEAVRQGNYAGINLDYHAVSPSLKEEFTDFVTQLAAALEADGRTLTLTLPAPQGRGEDIDEGAYDWKQLGALAETIELLGELDQELYFQRAEDALDYVTARVDRSKVLLTIPSHSVERGSDGLRTMPLIEALAIAGAVTAQAEGAVTPSAQVRLISSNLASSEGASGMHWDETARAVTFKYPGLGGQRTVWIANEFSAAFRIALAQKFGLGGVVISDASVEGGGGNVWPAVQRALDEQQSVLSTPNGEILTPTWATGAGALSAASGEEVTWTAPAEDGAYEVMLIVSDGVIRAAQRIALEVATPE
jgi:spore germination protein YaaH